MGDCIPWELREKAQKENFEIRETKDGRIFGIRNIRQEIKRVGDNDVVTFIADIAGDMEAGEQFLKYYSDTVTKSFRELHSIDEVRQ